MKKGKKNLMENYRLVFHQFYQKSVKDVFSYKYMSILIKYQAHQNKQFCFSS